MGRGQEGSVFVFDEPTIGLHPLDVETLLGVFQTLMASGATVIVIEHDLDIIRNADYILDMGPGGGEEGGEIYLKPFEICMLEAKPRTVMMAYNLINGEHASSSRELLTDVLRNEWGFDGFVMSDWFVTGVGTALYDTARASRYASAAGHMRAGNDITMPGSRALRGIKKGSYRRK